MFTMKYLRTTPGSNLFYFLFKNTKIIQRYFIFRTGRNLIIFEYTLWYVHEDIQKRVI